MNSTTIRLGMACAVGVTLACVLMGWAEAQAPLDRSFSSLCTDPNDGDITGLRIKLTGTEAAPAVSFEEPEGALMAPTAASDVTFKPATGALTFKATTEAGRLAFEGIVGATMLDGTLKRADGDAEPVHLPRDQGGDGETACPPAADTAKP